MSQMKCSWVAWAMDELDLTRLTTRRLTQKQAPGSKSGGKYFKADPPRNKSELQDLRSTLRLGTRLSMSNFSILVIYNSFTVILAVSIGALIFLTLSVLDSSFPRATLFNLTSAWNCECWNLGSFWLVACELPMLLTKLRRKVDVALD